MYETQLSSQPPSELFLGFPLGTSTMPILQAQLFHNPFRKRKCNTLISTMKTEGGNEIIQGRRMYFRILH